MTPYKYGGALVHAEHDEYGAIEVVDEGGVRALYFGTPSRQSALYLAFPDQLELAYTRAMLSALLFCDDPQRLLLIGLGGGSLARFVWKHLPDAHIEVVEKRAGVAKVAREWFGLPDDPRLQVHIADGMAFVDQAAPDSYDLILVDAYYGYGMAVEIAQHAFYQRCALLLRGDGVLSTNLWGNHAPILARNLGILEEHYAEPVLQLAVKGRGNVVGLGFARTPGNPTLRNLHDKAARLERQLGLEFGQFLKQLRRAPPSAKSRHAPSPN